MRELTFIGIQVDFPQMMLLALLGKKMKILQNTNKHMLPSKGV
jgi:hypothetical protein